MCIFVIQDNVNTQQSLLPYTHDTQMMKTFFLFFLLFFVGFHQTQAAGGGKWVVLQKSIGITAMHMQLLNNDRVVIYDRTDFGQSNISLPRGVCPNKDCTAHSVEYNVAANTVRPLTVQTDVWCSSGTVAPNGQLIQTGGFSKGDRVVRTFSPCANCDWKEVANGLLAGRWYGSNHILPDGRAIIVGGRARFNYEFYPKTSSTSALFTLPFLSQTNDPNQENNLYPFVHLNVDGKLFIYANTRAILLDYTKNVIVRTYPSIPGGDPRNYPSTGSSVLLPLRNIGGVSVAAEVLICGGAPRGSYPQAKVGKFIGALNTCGRLKITDTAPSWVMEKMPLARVMGDMVLLPNGQVLIINGAGSGSAGWEFARNPVLSPVIYRPNNRLGSRFEVQNPSSIPRMYHSTAILLRDGRILVGGSNPHAHYSFTGVLFPTELRLEAFSPTYLDSQTSSLRPKITSISPRGPLKHGQLLTVSFSGPRALVDKKVEVTMVAPAFATHSFSMNQRVLVLTRQRTISVSVTTYTVKVTIPSTTFLAPPGYYMLFVNYQDIPSQGIWVQIQ